MMLRIFHILTPRTNLKGVPSISYYCTPFLANLPYFFVNYVGGLIGNSV
jgi:hypothetical protein